MKTRTIFEGCGVGIVATLPYIWPQLSPYHSDLYHSRFAMNSVAFGALIDLTAISAIFILIFAYLEKRGTLYRNLIWALVAARLASVLVQMNSVRTGQPNPGYLNTRVFFCVVLLAAIALRLIRRPAYEAATRGLGLLFAFAGCCVVWVIPELLYQGLVLPPPSPVLARAVLSVSGGPSAPGAVGLAASGRRIVWIVFDELSYAQTFEQRFPGLAMPAFDRLKSETVLFQNVEPAGYHTEHVLPALMLGDIVRDAKSDSKGDLYVRVAGHRGWRGFDSQATIFADARRLGWSNGIVGWYNPYCRILSGLLDFCYWDAEDEMLNGVSPQNSALQNAVAPFARVMFWLKPKPAIPEEEHARNLLELMSQAQKLIKDENIRFVFIHLPVPHPPGIFDRTTGQLRSGGTYIDNLALADRSLDQLVSTLRSTPSWPKTTLIVCSDHSWRVPLWRAVAGWSKEEEAASGGKFDPRPVLMIHFPGQSGEVDVPQSFRDIDLHAVLETMLHGGLQSPKELETQLLPTSAERRSLTSQTAKSPSGY